jgi:hypothetical protein
VEFPENPEFDDRFVVFGRDEYAVRDLLSGSVGSAIYQNEFLIHLAGSGDILTLDTSYFFPTRDQNKTIRDIYTIFLDLIQVFEERS